MTEIKPCTAEFIFGRQNYGISTSNFDMHALFTFDLRLLTN